MYSEHKYCTILTRFGIYSHSTLFNAFCVLHKCTFNAHQIMWFLIIFFLLQLERFGWVFIRITVDLPVNFHYLSTCTVCHTILYYYATFLGLCQDWLCMSWFCILQTWCNKHSWIGRVWIQLRVISSSFEVLCISVWMQFYFTVSQSYCCWNCFWAYGCCVCHCVLRVIHLSVESNAVINRRSRYD